MKKVAFMIVYNDEDYIEYSINAIKDLVDELVIVEGAFGVAIEKCGASPRSLDKTIEKIKKYADNNKVFHREGNGWAHKEQYQIAFDFAKERSADWAILVDSDEIWSPSLMKVFDAKVKTADKLGVYQYRLNTRNFVNDFNTWYPGQSPRIYRVTDDAEFIADNEIIWKSDNKHPDRGRAENHIHLLCGERLFHYGYVRRKNRWQFKQDYMYQKDYNPLNLQYKLEGDNFILPSDIPIYTFTGRHPKIMESHPFYNMTANQIIYGEEE
jgi:hypothetical protein